MNRQISNCDMMKQLKKDPKREQTKTLSYTTSIVNVEALVFSRVKRFFFCCSIRSNTNDKLAMPNMGAVASKWVVVNINQIVEDYCWKSVSNNFGSHYVLMVFTKALWVKAFKTFSTLSWIVTLSERFLASCSDVLHWAFLPTFFSTSSLFSYRYGRDNIAFIHSDL